MPTADFGKLEKVLRLGEGRRMKRLAAQADYIVQRVLACGTVSEGRKALCLSAVLVFPLFLIFLMVGVTYWTLRHRAPRNSSEPSTSPYCDQPT